MNSKLFGVLSLVLILGSSGCNGVKNSMRASLENSAWNPSNRTTVSSNDEESSWNPLRRLVSDKNREQPAKPVFMTAIWKDSVYECPGMPTVKGFGGRFYFYDENNVPVKAEGELIVYGFDDSTKETPESGADKRFVFRSEEFQQHFSESAIGASYSVWIPWEKIGGFRKSITLIPIFRMADGNVLKSGKATVNLPGKAPEPQSTETRNEMPYRVLGSSPAVIQQADFNSSNQSNTDGNVVKASFENEPKTENRIRTSTFRLTRNLAERMAQARNSQHQGDRKTTQSKAEIETTDPSNVTFESEIAADTRQKSTNQINRQDNPDIRPTMPKRPVFGQPGSY